MNLISLWVSVPECKAKEKRMMKRDEEGGEKKKKEERKRKEQESEWVSEREREEKRAISLTDISYSLLLVLFYLRSCC